MITLSESKLNFFHLVLLFIGMILFCDLAIIAAAWTEVSHGQIPTEELKMMSLVAAIIAIPIGISLAWQMKSLFLNPVTRTLSFTRPLLLGFGSNQITIGFPVEVLATTRTVRTKYGSKAVPCVRFVCRTAEGKNRPFIYDVSSEEEAAAIATKVSATVPMG